MTRAEKAKCKLFASDVRLSLRKSGNIGISAANYGLRPSEAVVAELARMLPGVEISTAGVMGYIHFQTKETS